MTDFDEKSPLQSKKFIAFLLADLTLKAMGVLIIAWAWNLDELSSQVFFLMLAVLVISGFLAIGFILGQAGLDRFVRLAQIAAHGATKPLSDRSALSKVVAKGTKNLVDVHPEVAPVGTVESEPPKEGAK